MDMDRKIPGRDKLRKIVGIGPAGAIVSLFLLAIFLLADWIIELTIVVDYQDLMKTIGIVLVILGLGLHFWSFSALRNWWVSDELCTMGPFKYFRHPMYAAWITFICPGVALYHLDRRREGIFMYPHEFPMDYYWIDVYHEAGQDGTSLAGEWKYRQIPRNIVFNLPDYSFSDGSFEEETGTFSWQLSGTTGRDLLVLGLSKWIDGTDVDWSVLMQPNRRTWSIPELPAPVNDWFAHGEDFEAHVLVRDYDTMSGFQDIWVHLTDFWAAYENMSRVYYGGYSIPLAEQ